MGETTDKVNVVYKQHPGGGQVVESVARPNHDPDSRLDGEEELDRIEAEIRQTETQLAGTIEALQEKLSFENIKREAEDKVWKPTLDGGRAMMNSAGEVVQDVRKTITEVVKENPVPTALIGVGLGWLIVKSMMGGSRQGYFSESRYEIEGGAKSSEHLYKGRSYQETYPTGYGGTYQSGGHGLYASTYGAGGHHETHQGYDASSEQHGLKDKVLGAIDTVKEKAGDLSHTVMEKAGGVQERAGELAHHTRQGIMSRGHSAQHYGQRAQGGFWDMIERNPMGVGLIATALGALVALSIPETRKEHEIMGETRDSLLRQAQDKAQEVGQQAKAAVGNVVEETRRAVTEEADRQRHEAGSVKEGVKKTATEGWRAAVEEAKDQNLIQ